MDASEPKSVTVSVSHVAMHTPLSRVEVTWLTGTPRGGLYRAEEMLAAAELLSIGARADGSSWVIQYPSNQDGSVVLRALEIALEDFRLRAEIRSAYAGQIDQCVNEAIASAVQAAR